MKRSAAIAAALVVAAVAAVTLLLASGRIAMVSTTGSSMQPGIRQGDLVVVARASGYSPGQTVAYQSKELGRVVLHRIESIQQGRFVLRGDANSWTDTDRPDVTAIVGRRVLLIPQGGRVLSAMRSPWMLLALAAVVLLVAGRRSRRDTDRPSLGGRRLPAARTVSGAVAATCASVAVASLMLPVSADRPASIPFRHEGRFSYSAMSSPNAAYGDGGATTGDPIFLKLAPVVDVRFEYAFETEAAAETSLTAEWEMVVDDGAGWRRSTKLERTAASGTGFAPSTRVDVAGLWQRMDAIERASGVTRGSYLVSLIPHVRVTGRAAGKPVDTVFAPALLFRLDAAQMRIDATPDSNPLAPTSDGRIDSTERVDARLPLLPVPVRDARIVFAAAALMALVVFATSRRAAADDGHLISVPASARRWIVPVVSLGEGTAVETEQVDDIFRIADTAGQLVLWQRSPGEHVYAVRIDSTTYLHRIGAEPAPPIAIARRRIG